MEAREAAVLRHHRRRRARRAKSTAVLVGGGIAVAGLAWVADSAPTDVEVSDDVVRVAAVGIGADDPQVGEVIIIRSSDGAALAGALTVRDGFIVTSGTALDGADTVIVSWLGTDLDGTVVGHDDVTDMTVIRVAGADLGIQPRDARVVVGDEITMPSEYGDTSQRVVAAASTSAKANGEPVVGIVELDGRIGDVPPGSPAFDIHGNVVGIATATADSAPTAIIPIDLAREVANEIIDDGEATHPRLGVKARSPHAADGLERDGALITAVTFDGPAYTGGVLTDDLLIRLDEAPIISMASMVATLRSYEPGDVVNVVVWRDGVEVNCTVELESHLAVDA